MSRTTGGGPDHEQPTGGRYGAPVMDTERVNAMSLGTCCEPRRQPRENADKSVGSSWYTRPDASTATPRGAIA